MFSSMRVMVNTMSRPSAFASAYSEVNVPVSAGASRPPFNREPFSAKSDSVVPPMVAPCASRSIGFLEPLAMSHETRKPVWSASGLTSYSPKSAAGSSGASSACFSVATRSAVPCSVSPQAAASARSGRSRTPPEPLLGGLHVAYLLAWQDHVS